MATTMSATQRRKGLNAILTVANAHKMALFTSAYTPGQTAYSTTNEASGTGYTAGGAAMSGLVNATGSSKAYGDAADQVFAGLTLAFRWAVWYNTVDANAVVLEQDLGAQSVTATDVTIAQPTAAEGTAAIQL